MRLLLYFSIWFLNYLHITEANTPFIIDCRYSYSNKESPLPNTYACFVQNDLNIKSKNDRTISKADPLSLEKSSQEVLNFVMNKENGNAVEFFPLGLEIFFPNLKVLEIVKGRLKEIHQDDLKPFTELIVLHLENNDIEYIENNLFKFNPNLERIILSYNKIKEIHTNVFDNLKNLHTLHLYGNFCFKQYEFWSQENRAYTLSVINNVKAHLNDQSSLTISGYVKMILTFILGVIILQLIINWKFNTRQINKAENDQQVHRLRYETGNRPPPED